MDLQQNDKTEQLRSVLKRMERSIDDARTRRTRGAMPETGVHSENTVRHGGQKPSSDGFDPLDTPIADSPVKRAPHKDQPRSVRDERSMFDFEGPRLKARAKRRNAS